MMIIKVVQSSVCMICYKNILILLILLGFGSSHSMVDVRMVHVVSNFALIDRL